MPSNTELVREAFAAVQANDVDALIQLVTGDVEFHSITGRVAGRGPYLGREGLREWDRDRNATWELEAETTAFEERGDVVLVDAYIRTTGAVSGVRIDTPTSWVVELRGGKIARIEGFTDREAAAAKFAKLIAAR